MWKLIRLEWRKNRIGKYAAGAVAAAALLGVFLFALAFLGIANDPDGTLDAAPGANTISSSIELFSGMVFLIFASVMLSSFVVSPYKNKTMNLMFTYPIRRQKILAAQMAAVWIFNFAALALTKLFLYGCIWAGNKALQSSFVIDVDMMSGALYIQVLLKSFVTVSMSFIAMFVGLLMKSSKAVVVMSFFLVFLTQANIGDFTLAGNAVFPVILTAISFGLAAFSVWRVEKADLIG